MKKFSILYFVISLFCFWGSLAVSAGESITNQQIPTINSIVTTPLSTEAESSSQEVPVGSGVIFQPRVWTGAMNLKHDMLRNTISLEGGKQIPQRPARINFESTMPILGVGATLVYKRFFLDGYVQKTSTAKDKATDTYDLPSSGTKKTATTDADYEFEREDYSASLGYRVTDRFIVFGGYRSGQTSYDEKATSFTSDPKDGKRVSSTSREFKAQGPFVGLSYSYPVSERGQLGFNVGYAKLDGEYTQTEADTPANSTSGLTYGINWKGSLYKNLSYGLSLDKYDYEFSELKYSSRDKNQVVVSNHTLSIKDEILTFKFTLSYTF